MVVKAEGVTQNPSGLSFSVESRVFSRGAIMQTIELYDFDADQYELLDSRQANRVTDEVVSIAASGDPVRFIQPGTGCVEARIRYQSAFNRARFTANIDHVFWMIDE